MSKLVYFVYCCNIFVVIWAAFDCVAPPMECPNENITFWLYTSKNCHYQYLGYFSSNFDDLRGRVALYTGFQGVAISEVPGSIPGWVNLENELFYIGSGLGVCCSTVVSDFHNTSALATYFGIGTIANKDSPRQIFPGNPESIKSAPWVANAPIKILIHGYTGHKDFSPNTEIRSAYMECCDYNIVSVDYNPIAREPCYMEAARNTELVGMCTAQLIDDLVANYDFNLDRFHPIGFSLGGQIVGYIGNYLESGKMLRITALDPAMPLFVTSDNSKKVDNSDALFVDVLHTNGLWKGKLEACGHVDFYANGGMSQPGCMPTATQSKSGCDHARAPEYFAESILSEKGCYARKCSSWFSYVMGWCEPNQPDDAILYGEYVPHNASGLYFFNTNSKSPYCRGKDDRFERSYSNDNAKLPEYQYAATYPDNYS